eukprot:14080394-Alexandrium_andersonii.AAC.1
MESDEGGAAFDACVEGDRDEIGEDIVERLEADTLVAARGDHVEASTDATMDAFSDHLYHTHFTEEAVPANDMNDVRCACHHVSAPSVHHSGFNR